MDFLNMDNCYRKGYLAGYHNGYEDGVSGRKCLFSDHSHVDNMPIEAMAVSTRAYHCLHFAGCRSISDIAKMKKNQILQIRNPGKVTAAEVARSLLGFGILGTDWESFL